jgi:hypothetical protein
VKNAALLIAAVLAASVAPARAAVVSWVMPATPEFTTVPQDPPPPGGFANNGIWLTMTNGTPLIVSDNVFPGYADGQFQLRTVSYAPPAGEVVIQGFIANGNDIAVQGSGGFPSNPAYIPFGGSVGPSSSFIGFSSFVEMSGAFGNWNSPTPLRGALGVKFPNGTDIHYGFIDVTQLPDGRITLNGYAYNSVPGEPISVSAVPEPTSMALLVAGALPWLGRRLRRCRR